MRAALVCVLALAFAGAVDARPGGGHSSSSSHSSSSHSSSSHSSSSHSSSSHSSPSHSISHSSSPSHFSSSSGSSGSSGSSTSDPGTSEETFSDEPEPGSNIGTIVVVTMVLVVVVIVVIGVFVRRAMGKAYNSAALDRDRLFHQAHPPDWSDLLASDPDFSRAVFEDFAFELYAHAHRMRGTPGLLALTPYLSPNVIAHLQSRGPAPTQVVIGTLRIDRCETKRGATAYHEITVAIEATHLGQKSMFAVENWVFVRVAGVRSKPPATTRTWPCPHCGAVWVVSPTRNCAHCGVVVEVGTFDWSVNQIVVESEKRALASLTGTVAEVGNDLPTVFDPVVESAMQDITSNDPAVTFETLKPRIALIYDQVTKAWNASDLTPIRGYVTAAQRNYLEYWLREYAHQGLRNNLTDARIRDVHLAKVVRDRYFDAITVRVFADGCDSTSNAKGKIVGGSTTKRRAYTEYWTFLRSSTRRGPVIATPTCSNCGAPLTISDAGSCLHCNALVENGSFDWVLSKIEQDDVYIG